MRPDLRPAVLLLAGVVGCTSRATPPAEPAAALAPVTVSTVRPERKSLVRLVEQPGAVHPYEETDLYAKVSGYVIRIDADIGQTVKSGEVLAELSVPELVAEEKQKQAAVRQAEAEQVQAEKAFASAGANVKAMEAAVVEARAGITRAQAHHDRWESEATRVAGLVQRGVIDSQTRDETQNQFKAAQAARDEARARVTSAEALVRKAQTDRDKAEADVDAAAARVEVARADASRLTALVGYTKIRAPYDGIVTRRFTDLGDLLQAGGGTGAALFTVVRLDPVRLVVRVPEADAALVVRGSEVRLTVPALKREITGKVARTSWALEPGVRTLRTEIDAPNPDGRLRPGMYLHARFVGHLPEAWTLSTTAIVKQGDAMVCFLAIEDRAVRVPVQVGHTDGKFIEVLRVQQAVAADGWTEFTGKEEIIAKTAGLVDGLPLKRDQ